MLTAWASSGAFQNCAGVPDVVMAAELGSGTITSLWTLLFFVRGPDRPVPPAPQSLMAPVSVSVVLEHGMWQGRGLRCGHLGPRLGCSQ